VTSRLGSRDREGVGLRVVDGGTMKLRWNKSLEKTIFRHAPTTTINLIFYHTIINSKSKLTLLREVDSS